LDTDEQISVDTIVNIITGVQEKPIMLLEVFRDHNAKITALIETEYAPGTVERYATTLFE